MFPCRSLFTGLGSVGILYGATCGYFWSQQVDLIFQPLQNSNVTPDELGMQYEDVVIPVGSGPEQGELHGFWLPAEDSEAPAFLYLHGQDDTIGKALERVERLHRLGFHVLAVDYRGFGRSYGTTAPSEDKVYEDAEAAWDYLTGERDFEPSRTFIYGHSLGGAIAIDLATRHPDAGGLITECTFTCALDMARLQYSGCLRVLPLDAILSQRFESLDKISTLEMPILLIHGTADTRVPCRMAGELYAAAPGAKELLLIDGGGHADCGTVGWEGYSEKVSAFVEGRLSDGDW